MPNSQNGEKKKRNFSPETREKLSKLAKERHARGELGGAEFGRLGGRPRKDRASKAVAEAAQEEENRTRIIQVFKDATDPSQPMGLRLKGATAWLDVEQQEGKLALQEEEADARQLGREELIKILSERLTSGPSAQLLQRRLGQLDDDQERFEEENVVDAEVVDDG